MSIIHRVSAFGRRVRLLSVLAAGLALAISFALPDRAEARVEGSAPLAAAYLGDGSIEATPVHYGYRRGYYYPRKFYRYGHYYPRRKYRGRYYRGRHYRGRHYYGYARKFRKRHYRGRGYGYKRFRRYW